LAFANRAAELGVTRSFGSTGDCSDNAAVESLRATLKRDLNWIYGKKTWRSKDMLRSATFDYIEGFYNPKGSAPSLAMTLNRRVAVELDRRQRGPRRDPAPGLHPDLSSRRIAAIVTSDLSAW